MSMLTGTSSLRACGIGLGLLAALAVPDQASAQGPGLRAGVGLVSPGFVGAHYDVRMDQSDSTDQSHHRKRELWFRPSVEYMLGDQDEWLPRTMVNLEFRIQRPIASNWARYAGTGLTISKYRHGQAYRFGMPETSWHKGIEFVTGVASRKGTFIEAKFDPSVIKFGIGYTFGRRQD
ncbi:MAG: hypothetical protein EHM35_11920 [Planctomycetaceae bacterium]|nr:MAG: hypothetical protein EHM35_11920 [Planctomycetaceae bacterium]